SVDGLASSPRVGLKCNCNSPDGQVPRRPGVEIAKVRSGPALALPSTKHLIPYLFDRIAHLADLAGRPPGLTFGPSPGRLEGRHPARVLLAFDQQRGIFRFDLQTALDQLQRLGVVVARVG